MSRIGKIPVQVPSGVKVALDGSTLKVNGALGSLELAVNPEIILELKGSEIEVTRGNDGRSARAGVGLQSMQERAELLGAQLRITSAPGAGTTVRIECRLDSSLMEGDEDGRNKAHAGR